LEIFSKSLELKTQGQWCRPCTNSSEKLKNSIAKPNPFTNAFNIEMQNEFLTCYWRSTKSKIQRQTFSQFWAKAIL